MANLPTPSEVHAAAEAHLRDQHATLWADWDLTRPERFQQALTWLTGEVISVLAKLGDHEVDRLPYAPPLPQRPEVVVTESGRRYTIERPPLPFPQPYRVTLGKQS